MKAHLIRFGRAALLASATIAMACGQNPASTEKARGVLTGANLVVALSIVFIVVAGGLLVAAVGIDRVVRSRRALESAPAEPEEEPEEEIVAGIAVGRAGVPRWLYGFYVLIPVFAFLYVVNNVALRPAAEEAPGETEEPQGPVTETTITASGITFDKATLTFPAATEVTVTFDNADTGVPHDFTVWESEAAATANDAGAKIAATNQIAGGASDDIAFTIPEPGEYYFNCTIHPPSMFGTVEVVEGS